MYSYRFAVQHSSKLSEVSSAWMHFLPGVTRELVTLRSTAALLMILAELRIRWSSSSIVFTLCAYTIISFNPTHGNLMGTDSVTVVANSVHRHYQSIDLGIYDSDTALRPDWNEVALRHAGNTCHRVCRGTFSKCSGSSSYKTLA